MKPSPSSPEPGRLTIITSDAAHNFKLGPSEDRYLEALDRAANYNGYEQYSKSKLLITMFIQRLAELISPDEVIINCSSPGAVRGTAYIRDLDSWLPKLFFDLLFKTVGRTPVEGSKVDVHSSLVLGKEGHGSFTDWLIRAWPVILYSNVGRQIGDEIWNETMDQLRSAGIEGVLNGKKY